MLFLTQIRVAEAELAVFYQVKYNHYFPAFACYIHVGRDCYCGYSDCEYFQSSRHFPPFQRKPLLEQAANTTGSPITPHKCLVFLLFSFSFFLALFVCSFLSFFYRAPRKNITT